MTLTEILKEWIDEAERMDGGTARAVVVTRELLAMLVREQGSNNPVVAGRAVHGAASEAAATSDRPPLEEMVEVPGPDRICVYLDKEPSESSYPFGHDPAMPVFFVPVPPATLANGTELEMYNRLRWIGLAPVEALTGSRQ